MSNYAPIEWVPIEQPAPRGRSRVAGTRLSRWSVFLGIQSVLLGFLLPIPVLAIVFGWSGLTFWGGFIAICIWSIHVNYA